MLFTVSSSSSHYPLTSPSLYCLPALVLSSPKPLISVSPESLSVGLQRWQLRGSRPLGEEKPGD